MTTLAADQPRDYYQGDKHDFPMVATDIIYQGAAVGDNGSGYARPLVAGDPFMGFAELRADNSTGVAGAINVRVKKSGLVKLPISGLAITDKGKDVYASDDNTFTLTQGSNTRIGYVDSWIESGYGIVNFAATRGVQTELTDNTGGTANTTLTALGGITTLTDNTGGSGTHDDTLDDGLTSTAFTADNGGGTADGTVEVITSPAVITNGTMGGTADGAFETVGATNGGDVSAAIMNNFKEVQAFMTATNSAITAIANDIKECTTKIATLITDVTVQNQNDSDIAQKVIELVADMDDAKNNFADVTASINTIIRRLDN